LLLGVKDGAEANTGLVPAAVAPAELSTGVIDAPLQSPITPAAKFGVMVQV